MDLTSAETLFSHELQEIYDMEQQGLKGLAKMATAASDKALKEAFEQHREETEEQVNRLEEVFAELDEEPQTAHSKPAYALFKEAEMLIEADGDANVKDAALIVAAQCNEHLEIAKYGAARTHAQQLGLSKVADLLEKTLDEEKATDKKLNKVATGNSKSGGVNKEAAKSN